MISIEEAQQIILRHIAPLPTEEFAILEGKPVFALPGNPAAAMISFEVFVRPALLKMTGHKSVVVSLLDRPGVLP
jgi:molybdopterin biosynthesis enzyme MoaB